VFPNVLNNFIGESQKGLMSQGLYLGLSLGLTQSHELSLSILQGYTASLSMSRSGSPFDPKGVIQAILKLIAQRISNPQLRQAAEAFIQHPDLGRLVVDSREKLAVAKKDRITEFGVDFVFMTCSDNGEFIHARDENGKPFLNPPKTTGVNFSKAYFTPETFRKKIEKELASLQALGSTVGSVDEYTGMVAAQTIVEHIRKNIDLICIIIELLFEQRSETNTRVLEEYLRGLVIQENLDLILSERMLKRFVTRFKRACKKAKAYEYEPALLNTIAEFTLISMGIILPELFELGTIDTETEWYQSAKDGLRKIGVPINTLLERFNLKGSGDVIWFNRYATAKVKSTPKTEAAVRDFITETVRANSKEVLTAVDFPTLFARIKEHKASSDDPDDFAESACRELSDTLSGASFQEAFGKLLHIWYPKMEQLM
jgi:hypothetical protein